MGTLLACLLAVPSGAVERAAKAPSAMSARRSAAAAQPSAMAARRGGAAPRFGTASAPPAAPSRT
ncbi:hypothetical protein EPO15_07105, partial [bacterium]